MVVEGRDDGCFGCLGRFAIRGFFAGGAFEPLMLNASFKHLFCEMFGCLCMRVVHVFMCVCSHMCVHIWGGRVGEGKLLQNSGYIGSLQIHPQA